jgi:quercetin dioxygenase-like cupin family protein
MARNLLQRVAGPGQRARHASRETPIEGRVSKMAIPHAQSGQVIDVRPLGASLTEERTIALFKTDDLEVMRLILTVGKSMPPHKVAGEITIQCIEGKIDVTLDGESNVLEAGQLMYLARNVVHGVVAVEDASVLVTIALLRPSPAD